MLRQGSPTGRFSSEAAWQGTVNRRRIGAGSCPLFLTELLDELAQHDVDPPAYPPHSPESLISALFFSGSPSREAFESKLAVLAYGLVDANFFTAPDLAESLRSELGIPESAVLGWILLLFLDDAQLVKKEAENNSSLVQAVNCLPGVNGPKIPFRALRTFLDKGRSDVALALLRQRDDKDVHDINAACTALKIRLVNGLFSDAFIEMQRHLESTPEVHRAQHAQRLMEEFLEWGADANGLHAIIRLPIDLKDAEPALLTWLQNASSSFPQAGLLLTIYLLIRGRSPEALLAYAEYGRAAQEDQSLATACSQLEDLLRAAARMMPAAQRALVVASAPETALVLPSQGRDVPMVEVGAGVAVASALQGLETGNIPSLVSMGPSHVEAPLVGGILASQARVAQGRFPSKGVSKAGPAGQGGVLGDAAAGGSLPQGTKAAAAPLLFGQTPIGSSATAGGGGGFGLSAMRAPGSIPQFGSVVKSLGAPAVSLQQGGNIDSRRQHRLDALLGVAPVSGMKSGIKDRQGLR